MRKSKAKQAIINTAQNLIEKKGYSNLNVNEVAYVAKVSVGTLYYHFPKGKMDILAEIMSRKTDRYVEEFTRQLRDERVIEQGTSLDDTLRLIFKKVIEFRRTDRQFLSAIHSEMFSKPDEFMELVKKYQSTDGLQHAMSVLSDVMMKATKTERGRISELEENQERIQRVVGLLMSYQIIFPGYFGDDDEFVDLAIRLFFELMK